MTKNVQIETAVPTEFQKDILLGSVFGVCERSDPQSPTAPAWVLGKNQPGKIIFWFDAKAGTWGITFGEAEIGFKVSDTLKLCLDLQKQAKGAGDIIFFARIGKALAQRLSPGMSDPWAGKTILSIQFYSETKAIFMAQIAGQISAALGLELERTEGFDA